MRRHTLYLLVGFASWLLIGPGGVSAGVIELAKLLASDGAASDAFVSSVAVSGDSAVVGALLDDDNGSDSGSAYVIPLPEPSGLLILAVGIGFLATIGRRRTRP
jgi:hypothetical protein